MNRQKRSWTKLKYNTIRKGYIFLKFKNGIA